MVRNESKEQTLLREAMNVRAAAEKMIEVIERVSSDRIIVAADFSAVLLRAYVATENALENEPGTWAPPRRARSTDRDRF